MDIPRDILEARSFLEQAEKESNPERKLKELREGIDLLELYKEENPNISEELSTYIKNLRRSHTRSLLSQLLSISKIEFEAWFDYIVLLITKLEDEINYAIENDPELKENYDKFCALYSDVLKEALKDYAK